MIAMTLGTSLASSTTLSSTPTEAATALNLSVPHRVLELPATALYNDAQGLRVAVVDAGSKVHFAPITIERDSGATFQIATGLTGDERVIKIAVPSLVEGDIVEVVAPPTPAAPTKP